MEICEFAFIPEDKEKPIKIVFENDSDFVETDDCMIEYIKRLSSMDSEQFLKKMFGLTNICVFDCSDMTDEEIDRIVNN